MKALSTDDDDGGGKIVARNEKAAKKKFANGKKLPEWSESEPAENNKSVWRNWDTDMRVVVPIKYAFVGLQHLVNRIQIPTAQEQKLKPKIQIRHNWIDVCHWCVCLAHFGQRQWAKYERKKRKKKNGERGREGEREKKKRGIKNWSVNFCAYWQTIVIIWICFWLFFGIWFGKAGIHREQCAYQWQTIHSTFVTKYLFFSGFFLLLFGWNFWLYVCGRGPTATPKPKEYARVKLKIN